MSRAIEWRRLLADEGVPFIERGANVKRGEINIRCPFCGSADPSYHMGLNLDTGWWSCWRNRAAHSGKSPLRLLMALLRIPYWRARELAGLGEDFIDPEGFSAVAARLLGRSKGQEGVAPTVDRKLRFPDDLEPFGRKASSARGLRYLEHRGFSGDSPLMGWHAQMLAECYDLRWASSGHWRDRIIIPYCIGGELVSWTGRAIAPAAIRYLDLSVDESIIPVKETLFNYDCIERGGRALVIVEGPLDALKVDFYGFGKGVRAVALSTNSLNEEQAFMVEEAVGRFDHIYVSMDNSGPLSIIDGMKMKQELGFIPGIKVAQVPYGLKDAGELTPVQAIQWTDQLSKGTT